MRVGKPTARWIIPRSERNRDLVISILLQDFGSHVREPQSRSPSSPLLKTQTSYSNSKSPAQFMKREDSLPFSQESAMGLYSEPHEFSLKIYLASFLSLGQGIQNIYSLEVY
jgi:hypothetical protein